MFPYDNEKLNELKVVLYNAFYQLIPTRGIQQSVDLIEPLLEYIEQHEHAEVLQEAVNSVKHYVQWEARLSVEQSPKRWGLLAMATGSGKSKIPIDAIINNIQQDERILIMVPTEKLRDTGWKEEFTKWGAGEIYDNHVEITCYASLNNYVGQCFTYGIGDEFHNITDPKLEFFRQNTINNFYALSASPPKNPVKLQLLEDIGLPTTYYLSLEMAIRLRLVSPFEMIIVEVNLDDTHAYIPGGNATNRFWQTEYKAYQWLTKLVEKSPSESNVFKRINFVKNLVSVKNASTFVLENLLPPDERTLIFCGSINQAIQLCPHRYFSKPTVSKKDTTAKQEKVKKILLEYQGDESLNRFIAMEINRLSCVNRLNEGANLPMLDNILITFLFSGDKDLIQMIGRLIRYRIDHLGRVIIMVPRGTMAMMWLDTAIAGFDKSKIRRVRFNDLVNRTETLFN